jgi:dihydrodipicolinate synthase/N-acetylneuraminate lyase
LESTERLVDDALSAAVDGLLVPVIASEVEFLTAAERRSVVRVFAARVRGRVPIILGASASTPGECAEHAQLAVERGLAACLVAIPGKLYGQPGAIEGFCDEVSRSIPGPLVLQDFQFNGFGLQPEEISRLKNKLQRLAGIKIETVPAGPKYSAVRAVCGHTFWIAGGWAVPQMIEALDRGVDAMIPESAMIRVYQHIARLYHEGNRTEAVRVFRRLLPVLAFTNQEVGASAAFFKRLLVRKNFFRSFVQRMPIPACDSTGEQMAEALIEHYLVLEAEVAADSLRRKSPP